MPNTVNSYIETDLGNVSPNPRGEYNATYDYEYLDLIYYKGGSYLCLAPLGETIKNVPPIVGQTTTNWQCVAIPGDLTPEYISMYNEVVKDYNETNTNTADVAQMKDITYASMTAAQESESKASTSEANARNSEVNAKQSMDKAKEYSDEAIRVNNDTQSLVTGFDEHVATAISNAEASISESTDNAKGEIVAQKSSSLNEFRTDAETVMTNEKNVAVTEIHQMVDSFSADADSKKQEIIQVADEKINDMTALKNDTVNAKNAAETAANTAVEKASETATYAGEAKSSSDSAKANADLVSANKIEIDNAKSDVESKVEQFESDLETYSVRTLRSDMTELQKETSDGFAELKGDIVNLESEIFNNANVTTEKYENRWVYNGTFGFKDGYVCYVFATEIGESYNISVTDGGIIEVGFSSYYPVTDNNYVLKDVYRADRLNYSFTTTYSYCVVFAGKMAASPIVTVTKTINKIDEIENKIDEIENKIDEIEKCTGDITVYNGYIDVNLIKEITRISDPWVNKLLLTPVIDIWVNKIVCHSTWCVRAWKFDKTGMYVERTDFVKEYSDFDFADYDYRLQFRKDESYSEVHPGEFNNNVTVYFSSEHVIANAMQSLVKNGFAKLEEKITDVAKTYIHSNGLYTDYATTKDYVLCHNDFKYNGKLVKSGAKILNSAGVEIMLQGIGTHSLTEYNPLYSYDSVKTLKYYGINLIRVSVYLSNFYPEKSNHRLCKGWLEYSDEIKPIIEKLIDNATRNNMYVLLDWHSYHSIDGGDVTQYTSQQEAFFEYYASKYASYNNVLYELHNEPYGNTATELLPSIISCTSIIRGYNQDAIIVCGHGSDGVEEANRVWNTLNNLDIFISPHLYTGEQNTNSISAFISNNLPIFVSEWGNSSLSGDDIPNYSMAYNMFNLMFQNKVSNALWKWTYQNMDTAVLTYNESAIKYAYPYGGYVDGLLSSNGKFYFDMTFDGMIKDLIN